MARNMHYLSMQRSYVEGEGFRMKKLLVVMLLVMAATMAYADTAKINYVSSASGGDAGPYLFTVTPVAPPGDPFDTYLVCWSDFNQVPHGETYDIYSIGNVPVPGPFLQTLDSYKEIAYLASLMLSDPTSPANADIQVAVWLVAGLYNNDLVHTPAADAYVAEAIDQVVNHGYDAAGAVFYIAENSSKGEGPQPLVGFVPEPGSLILLGSGLVSVAGAIRRRLSA